MAVTAWPGIPTKNIVPEKPMEKITDLKIVQEKLAGIVEFEEQGNYLGVKKH
ncbi:hypothetical protein [Sphingobacterium gobiense]|uniref:hypothetical protein n=1 Tax=Sphingobacterium gobiense TaxID=1382456 RepID=UPI0015E3541E|nr:hypothetical protein [Sphingobacterium gobiense]